MIVQHPDRKDVSTFEGDKLLADIIGGYVEVGNGSPQDQIDDGNLRIIARTNSTFLNCTRLAADYMKNSAGCSK